MVIRSALCGAAVIALATGYSPSHAGVMAVGILEINNFMATDTAGTQLQFLTQIGAVFGNNTADVSATLNGITASDSGSAPLPAGNIDLLQQCVGACPPFPENSYAGVGFAPPPTGTYAVSDMVLTGSAIDTSPVIPNSGGVDARTRADVVIAGGSNNGTSVTNTGADVAFTFVAPSDLTAQFELDFITQIRAFLDTAAGETGSAQATVAWNLSILDLTAGGVEILNWAPGELNTSRSATLDGTNLFVDNSGSLISPTFLLETGGIYQLTLRHAALADADFTVLSVPEPTMTALFGVGLMLMGFAVRRRQ